MRAFAAYQQTQNLPTTRIDLILALYRQALELLERAALALGQKENALPHLAKAQMVVMALASGIPANPDEPGKNFLRLYEFVSHQLTQNTIDAVADAAKVLRSLQSGFENAREKALDLEQQGKIPPLGADRLISIKV